MVIGWTLLAIGSFLGLVAFAWLVVAAFRISLAWGLAVLFLGWLVVPIIIFVIQNWYDTRRPFAIWVFGIVISLVGYLALFMAAGNDARTRFREAHEAGARAEVGPGGQILPDPRPTALPTYPPWEKIIEDTIAGADDESWESIVATPTPEDGATMPNSLSWDQAERYIGRLVTVELTNKTEITGALEIVEPNRLRVRHVIGGGEASYWIARSKVAEIRPARQR